MSTLDKSTPTQLQNGLNKDLNFQRSGDVSFALNAIRDAHDGGKYEYQSEPGNEQIQGLPSGYTFMGSINGNDNKVYIFATNNSGLGTIGTFKNGFYTEQVRTSFDWKTNFPITGEFRVKNGCENIIYWCNGDTWDGYYNFDRPLLFQDELGDWVPNKFKLVPDVLPVKIDLINVNDSGGFLPLGSYSFQAEYLDSSLNSIYKTDISPQTVIFDDSFGESYKDIDGGLNIAQYSEEIGGVPITNKSITLQLSNLNTDFAFIRINVARQLTGNEAVDAHAVGALIAVSTDTIEWTYQGYNVSAGDYPLDYSAMITDNIRYDTAYVMEQVQGRLLRANLKQGAKDYSTYQNYASKTITKWVAKEVPANDITAVGDAKNPHTYWSGTGFQGDEVYAIGIRYLHSDGVWSPVFHIPGRPMNNDDNDILTVVDNAQVILGANEVWESDVAHLNLTIGNTVKRWKVFNTATVTNINVAAHPYDYEGEMGYYETDITYPNITTCDLELIWGKDYNDNDILTTTKIRHHKFPDRRMISHHRNDGDLQFITPYGIKFDNIEYPNADIKGHQFCYVKRTEFNKTVLDSGYFTKEYDDVVVLIAGDFSTINGVALQPLETAVNANAGTGGMVTGRYGSYSSTNVMYNKTLFTPSYLKLNTHIRYDIIETAPSTKFTILGGGTISIGYSELKKTTDVSGQRQNFKVLNQLYVNPQSLTLSNFSVNVLSGDFASPSSVIEVNTEIPNVSDALGSTPAGYADSTYAYKKSQVTPYGDLFNLSYNYINYNYNSSLLATDNTYYNGDTLIVLDTVTRVVQNLSTGSDLNLEGVAHNRFEEQTINVNLRYGGTLPSTSYYKIDGNFDWLLFRVSTLDPNGEYAKLPVGEWAPEFYAYNKDYNKSSLEYIKSVIPVTYNYCSECSNEFQNKIIFSPKSFDEESFDLYRINKINDSITIPANRGKITGLKYQNDYILVHTENSLYILQPNPQALSTEISSVYLTTGGFLSLPPNEIVQNDIGFAGCQHKQHMCETPFGHAWCDQVRGQIFLFDTKLVELSSEEKGLTQWFKKELPSYLQATFFDFYNLPYEITSTYNVLDDGIGIIMYYDPRFKRLIITKKDFKPLNLVSEGFYQGSLHYDLRDYNWSYYNNGNFVITTTANATYFENKSWTISYSFSTNSFTSWHSYRPEAAFSDNMTYYTLPVVGTTIRNIWRHKEVGNYQKYYNFKNFFIIDWMTSDFSTDNFSALHYNGYALSWDTTHKQWKPVNSTFQYGHIYTMDQSSGVFTMTLVDQNTNPYGNIGHTNAGKFVIKTDNNYKLSGIYDIAITSPTMTSDWTFVQNWVGYIDQLMNAAAHDFTKSSYNIGHIKDKFVNCRLFYNPAQDYKKVITLLQTNETRSIR